MKTYPTNPSSRAKLTTGHRKLGEVCEINMGQSPASSTYNQDKIGLPFYQGKKDYGGKYPVPRVWCSSPIKIVEAGDILISVRAPVGALNIASEKSCIGRGLAGLRGKSILYQNYLFHFLKLKEKKIADLGTGSTFTAISKKHLETIKIPLPPLAEQKKIVAKLEKVLAKIGEAKKLRIVARENTDNLLPAELHKIFSQQGSYSLIRANKRIVKKWEEKELGKICEINPKKSEVKNKPDNLPVSFVPMAAVDEFSQEIVSFGKKKLEEVRKGYTYFRDGDVLFAKITPCMENGKVAIARNLKNGIGFGTTEFHVIRPKEGVLPEWIYAIIRHPEFRDVAKIKMTGSAGQKRVPVQFLETFKIPLPPLIEQKKIVARLDSLSQKIQAVRELQNTTENEFNLLERALLSKAFSGKITS